jgi:hypothetical protein
VVVFLAVEASPMGRTTGRLAEVYAVFEMALRRSRDRLGEFALTGFRLIAGDCIEEMQRLEYDLIRR